MTDHETPGTEGAAGTTHPAAAARERPAAPIIPQAPPADPRETLRRRQSAARKAWRARKHAAVLRALDAAGPDLRPAGPIPTGRDGAAGAALPPAAPAGPSDPRSLSSVL